MLVPTGLAFEIPEGYEMQIRPRSGITLKTKLRVQLGTVDCGYTGEVGVIVDNIAERITPFNSIKYEHIDGTTTETAKHVRYCNRYGDYVKQDAVAYKTYIIRKGDRIAQAVIKPIEQAVFTEVDALGDSDRGAGGFGWSGTTFRKEY
ncbi:5'-triphosphate nucleotidohydrolase [Bacillus subtilis]|nr:5'-triphosphate nucleotidohydrolase [Bacillus subtilis]